MKLYIVRHGETDWNKARKLQGTADIPLNEYGRELARATALGLREIPFDAVYASPLIRAKETAEIIVGKRDIPVVTDARLMEMDFGSGEGTSISAAEADPENPFYFFLRQPEKYVPSAGESFQDVENRARSFIQEVILPGEDKWQNMLIASHGGFIRSFLNCIEKRELADFWNGIPQKNCAVTIAECRSGRIEILEEGKLFY